MSNDLVNRILKGEEKAVVYFYRHYAPYILRYIKKKTPERDADEILNEVFLEAIDELILLRNHDRILPYLYSIAHNKIVNYYRKKKIKNVLFSQIPYLEIVSRDIDRPDFQFEKNRIRDKIEETLHALSKQYRTILRLHYMEDIPIKQIAVIMDISYKAAESLLYRARRNFISKYSYSETIEL